MLTRAYVFVVDCRLFQIWDFGLRRIWLIRMRSFANRRVVRFGNFYMSIGHVDDGNNDDEDDDNDDDDDNDNDVHRAC